MHFTAEQVENMRTILRRLEPGTIEPIQFFTPDNECRTGCTIVINNKFGKPICLFQNYMNFSPYRKRLILRLSGQIPFEIHITQPREGLTRIGWKYQK